MNVRSYIMLQPLVWMVFWATMNNAQMQGFYSNAGDANNACSSCGNLECDVWREEGQWACMCGKGPSHWYMCTDPAQVTCSGCSSYYCSVDEGKIPDERCACRIVRQYDDGLIMGRSTDWKEAQRICSQYEPSWCTYCNTYREDDMWVARCG